MQYGDIYRALDDIWLEISKSNKWLKLSYHENGVKIASTL
jgi:hypothetical protein